MKTLHIGTRKSELALWQAGYVRARLLDLWPDLVIELVPMTTAGDRILDRPLATLGGKGLFIKELEQALIEGRIDLAVHSMKDLTVTLPEPLHVAAICVREDPRDAVVSSRYAQLTDLPAGSTVGTSSLRRQCQLRAAYPTLKIVELRGNVNTRIKRLNEGRYDALILAMAGLKRLGLMPRVTSVLAISECLPAVGQGAIGIECRRDDNETNQRVAPLDDPATRTCITAERAMNAALEGGCQVPIGGYAEIENRELHLRGLVGDPDGSHIIRGAIRGAANDGERLGTALAQDLLARGAKAILTKVYGRS